MEQLDKVGLSGSLELNPDKRAAEDAGVRRSPGENSDSSLHPEDVGSLPLLPGAPSGLDEYVSKTTAAPAKRLGGFPAQFRRTSVSLALALALALGQVAAVVGVSVAVVGAHQ